MAGKARVVISIVISAVLLGLVVSYCVREWMPTETIGWAKWGVMVLIAIYAIYRIATLAKALGAKEENE
uniref:hypothetical protein n=1 Tax=Alistipes sp. TaxID=1872444 RepID=UPI004055DE84